MWTLVIVILLPTLQIGFPIFGMNEITCLEVDVMVGYTYNGSYIVTGEKENEVIFSIVNFTMVPGQRKHTDLIAPIVRVSYSKFSYTAADNGTVGMCLKTLNRINKFININYNEFKMDRSISRNDMVNVLKDEAETIFYKLSSISSMIRNLKKSQEISLDSNIITSIKQCHV